MAKRPKPTDPELVPPPSVERLQGFVAELSLRAGVGIASSKSSDFSDEIVGKSLAVMEGVTAHDVRITARRHQIEGEDLREISDWLGDRIAEANAPTLVYFDESGKKIGDEAEKKRSIASDDLDKVVAEQVAARLRKRGRAEVADAMKDFLLRILAGRLEATHLREFTDWLENRGKPKAAAAMPSLAAGLSGPEVGQSLASLTKRRSPELDLALPPTPGATESETPWRLEHTSVPIAQPREPQRFALRPAEPESAPAAPRSPSRKSMQPIPQEELDPRVAMRDTTRGVWRSNLSMAGGFGGMLYGERTGALGALAQQPAAGATAFAQPSVAVQATPMFQPQHGFLGAPGYGNGYAPGAEAFGEQQGGTGLASLDGAILEGAPGPRFPVGGGQEFGGASMVGVLPSGTPLYLPPHVAALLQQQYGGPPGMPPFPAMPGAMAVAPMVLYASSMFGSRPNGASEPTAGLGGQTRVSPTFAQVTILAPPARVVSSDLQARGAAMEFDWQSLVRQAGPVDAGGLEQMKMLLPPGAQIVYPAIHPSRLPRGAVNLNLTQEIASDLAGKAYGPAAAQASKSAAFAAHTSTGGTPPAAPLQASFVPGIAPLGGVLGPGAASAFGPKAFGDPMKEGAVRPELDFMGLKVKLAPNIGATPDVGAAVALQRPPSVFAKSIKPEQFSEAKMGLLRSAHDVDIHADPGQWSKAAPTMGLKAQGKGVIPEVKQPGVAPMGPPLPPVSLPRMDVATPGVPGVPMGIGAPGTIPAAGGSQKSIGSAFLPPIKPFAPPAVASPMATQATGASAALSGGTSTGSPQGGPPLTPTSKVAPAGGTPLQSTVQPAPPSASALPGTMPGAPSIGMPLMSTVSPAISGPKLGLGIQPQAMMPPLAGPPLAPTVGTAPTSGKASIGVTPSFTPMTTPSSLPINPRPSPTATSSGEPIVGKFQKSKHGPPAMPSPDFGAGSAGGGPPAAPTPPPSMPSAGPGLQPKLDLPDMKGKSSGAKIGSMAASTPPTPDKLFPSLPSLFQARQPKPVAIQRAETSGTRGISIDEGGVTPESSSDRGSGPNEISMLANEVWTILKRRLDREAERRGKW